MFRSACRVSSQSVRCGLAHNCQVRGALLVRIIRRNQVRILAASDGRCRKRLSVSKSAAPCGKSRFKCGSGASGEAVMLVFHTLMGFLSTRDRFGMRQRSKKSSWIYVYVSATFLGVARDRKAYKNDPSINPRREILPCAFNVKYKYVACFIVLQKLNDNITLFVLRSRKY